MLKPSEISLDAIVFAEVVEEAGAGWRLTLSTAKARRWGGDCAPSRHRHGVVHGFNAPAFWLPRRRLIWQAGRPWSEEIGKHRLDDADLEASVRECISICFTNSGQSCDAPTRLLVSETRYADAVRIAREVVAGYTVGDPKVPGKSLGPVANRNQFNKIQRLIQAGIDEGAELIAGGVGRPAGLASGFFVKPTVFAGVTNDMTVAREEIFGPVALHHPVQG